MSSSPPPPPPPPEGYGQSPDYGPPPTQYGSTGEPPQYGGPVPPPQYGSPAPKTSVLAVISLVTGILAIPCCSCFVFGIAAVITGYLGRKEIGESQGAKKGAGLAQAGLILGIASLVLGVVAVVLQVTGVLDSSYTYDFETNS